MISLQTVVFASALFVSSINSAYSFHATQESKCSDVDLRPEFSLKMRDQGDISWCYAHAAADYLQFTNRIPVQISAADIAVTYNKRRWPRFLRWINGGVVGETGFIRSALWDVSEIGYCPEEYFPSDTWTKRIMTGENAGQTVQMPLRKAVKEIADMVESIENGIYLIPSELPFVYEFKDMTHEQFYDAVFVHPTGNVLDELRSASCDAHRLPFPKEITGITMNYKNKNSFAQLNEILDHKQPLTVDFFYGFLNNIDSYKKTVPELHTTMLMGRRFNTANQQCQYLIKNSYGPDCAEYDKRHSCEAGYVWVSESSLYSAMTSFVFISELKDGTMKTASQTQDEPDSQSSPSVH